MRAAWMVSVSCFRFIRIKIRIKIRLDVAFARAVEQ